MMNVAHTNCVNPTASVFFIGVHRQRGLSLIELMVSLGIGLFITGAVLGGYIFTKQSFSRQEQLAGMQTNVRVAFENFGYDGRMAGHLGCVSSSANANGTAITNTLSNATTLPYAFNLGLEGYATTVSTVTSTTTLSSTVSNWSTNTSTNTGATNTIPLGATYDKVAAGVIATSDVLVLRGTTGQPLRMPGGKGATTAGVEVLNDGSTCSGGSARVSGFCPNSLGVVASCTSGHIFQATAVSTVAIGAASAGQLTHASPGNGVGPGNASGSWGSGVYTGTSEAFRLQTVMYYIGAGSEGPALMRKVYDGETSNPTAQELIDNVYAMKVTYGIDSTTPADGKVDSYVSANSVTDWNKVVSVRIGLLLRSSTPLTSGSSAPSSIAVNGTTITLPSNTAPPLYDWRAFNTTIALRNRIAYF